MRRGKSNQLRIIGGKWRGRYIRFPDLGDLRPTSDRVRETVFNWLQWDVPGCRCLDLFAGSGALGFEAASRGAGEVILVESSSRVACQLHENIAHVGASNMSVFKISALDYLQSPGKPFDIVFVDPPFRLGLMEQCLLLLTGNNWLKSDARVYLEYPLESGAPSMPPGLEIIRQKKAGNVGFGVARWQGCNEIERC
ncbi:16S rRNA (guanine(966)-N(2))-methyltransferase RsmD, partial [Acidihalobacter prosperus]